MSSGRARRGTGRLRHLPDRHRRIGWVAAATIIAIVGDVRRFPTAAHFASFTGTAPIAASSGDIVRYRLNLGGQRQMNKVLHTAAKVQAVMPNSRGRDYLNRRVAEGKTRAEATRALKRHLSNAVYRALLADVANKQVSGEPPEPVGVLDRPHPPRRWPRLGVT